MNFLTKLLFIWLDSFFSFRIEWQILFIIILFIFKVINYIDIYLIVIFQLLAKVRTQQQ